MQVSATGQKTNPSNPLDESPKKSLSPSLDSRDLLPSDTNRLQTESQANHTYKILTDSDQKEKYNFFEMPMLFSELSKLNADPGSLEQLNSFMIVCKHLVESGKTEIALEVINTIPNVQIQWSLLTAISERVFLINEVDKSIDIANKITDSVMRGHALSVILKGLKEKNPQKSQAVAEMVPTEYLNYYDNPLSKPKFYV